MNCLQLSDDGNSAKFSNDISEINFEEKDGKFFGLVSNAVYTGEFKHHQGNFKLTEAHIDDFIRNYESKAIGIEPAINYNHNIHKEAAGWPIKMTKVVTEKQLSENKIIKQAGINMEVNWTRDAADAIKQGKYKYFSIEFAFDFVNSETQEKVKNAITGGALTNKPFLKGTSVMSLNDKNIRGGKGMTTKNELKLSLKTDFDLDVDQLEKDSKQLAETQKEVKSLQAQVKTLADEKAAIEKQILEGQVDHKLEELIREGKVVPAEKDMFREFFCEKGLEKMNQFAETMTVKVKTAPVGASQGLNDTDLSEEAKYTAQAEKMSKEKEISFSEAYKVVIRGVK